MLFVQLFYFFKSSSIVHTFIEVSITHTITIISSTMWSGLNVQMRIYEFLLPKHIKSSITALLSVASCLLTWTASPKDIVSWVNLVFWFYFIWLLDWAVGGHGQIPFPNKYTHVLTDQPRTQEDQLGRL